MIDTLLKLLYSLTKAFVVVAGVYVVTQPPYNWLGTTSNSIMVVAALISIYAIWTNRVQLEYVAIWFIGVGLGAYVGFSWVAVMFDGAPLARAAVASMALTLLAARGLSLWRLVLQINTIEKRREDNG